MIKILLILLFSSQSFANYDDYAGKKEFGFSDLQKLIENSGATSVDQSLKILKKEQPEFFKRYILMYRSRSLQQSSYLAPRALLVGPAAKLVISFNGDSTHRGFSNLEVMEYFDKGQRFEFRDIQFVKEGKPSFSKANPQKCMVCHQNAKRRGVDPRPNWEPYSLWPGAYGSNGNFRFNSNRFKYDNRIRQEDRQFLNDHLNEVKNYQEFESKVKQNHARYQLLDDFDSDLTVQFTDALLSHNYRRVVRLAKKTPFYQAYKYAFIASAKCGHIPWPKEFESWHSANNPKPERIRKTEAGPVPSCEDSFGDGGIGGPGDLSREQVAKICKEIREHKPKYRSRHISESISDIFESMGVDTSDWSTDFRTEGGRFAFAERFGVPTNPVARMQEAMKEVEPVLSKMSCKQLEEKSLASLSKFQSSGKFQQVKAHLQLSLIQKPAPLVSTCIRCHSDPDEVWVPQIPYDNPEKLKRFMLSKKYPRGSLIDEVIYRTGAHSTSKDQMPPSQVVSKKQRGELLDYLNSLMN